MMRLFRRYLLLFALFSGVLLHSQKVDTVFNRTVHRQYVALKYNIGLIGLFLGAEVLGTAAPYSWLHIQCSYRAYEMGLSGMFPDTPHRAGWDVYTDVRFHIPFDHTFTGFSIGPWYSYGKQILAYKERVGPYDVKVFDRFDIYRHCLGGQFGFSYCTKKYPRFLLEFYAGIGRVFDRQIIRRALENPAVSDHTPSARRDSEVSGRIGFCLGYVFR